MPYQDPEQRRPYQREHKHGARAGASNRGLIPRLTLVGTDFRLAAAEDVLALEEQVQAVRACEDAGTLEAHQAPGASSLTLSSRGHRAYSRGVPPHTRMDGWDRSWSAARMARSDGRWSSDVGIRRGSVRTHARPEPRSCTAPLFVTLRTSSRASSSMRANARSRVSDGSAKRRRDACA